MLAWKLGPHSYLSKPSKVVSEWVWLAPSCDIFKSISELGGARLLGAAKNEHIYYPAESDATGRRREGSGKNLHKWKDGGEFS